MKRLAILFALALTLALLAGCQVTSPKDEEFLEDWVDSMDEAAEDLEKDWEDALDEFQDAWDRRDQDGVEKDHYWKVLDGEGGELGTVTDAEQVKALDDLLSDSGRDDGHPEVEAWMTEVPGGAAYSYVFCQQETLKAGQKEEDREYEELVHFTVSGSEDAVTLQILEDLPSLLGADLGDLLTFTYRVPAEAAEALRDPSRFLE